MVDVCVPHRVPLPLRCLLLVIVVIAGFPSISLAQTTVVLGTPGLSINADLTVQGGASSMVDFSDSDVLVSKLSSASFTRRIMLKFDTQNFIPDQAVIQSA